MVQNQTDQLRTVFAWSKRFALHPSANKRCLLYEKKAQTQTFAFVFSPTGGQSRPGKRPPSIGTLVFWFAWSVHQVSQVHTPQLSKFSRWNGLRQSAELRLQITSGGEVLVPTESGSVPCVTLGTTEECCDASPKASASQPDSAPNPSPQATPQTHGRGRLMLRQAMQE